MPTEDEMTDLRAYIEARRTLEDLISQWEHQPGAPVPDAIRSAEDRVDALKAGYGEATPQEPLCCQRYMRLHHPVFSVSGCRWLMP